MRNHETEIAYQWLIEGGDTNTSLQTKAAEIYAEHKDDYTAELNAVRVPTIMLAAMHESIEAVLAELDVCSDVPKHGMMRDLLSHALRQVDTWHLARHYMTNAMEDKHA